MTARWQLGALVVLVGCATTTSERPGTEDWAQDRYKSAVTSCDSTHSYDVSVALSIGATTAASDAKYKACVAKADAGLKQDMDVVNGTAK